MRYQLDLRTLNACIRMPAMCDQYQKALRQRCNSDIKKVNKEAINHLRSLQIT